MSEKVKRQHFVSREYLRAFCFEGERINILDKLKEKKFTNSIANICVENNFYDLDSSIEKRINDKVTSKIPLERKNQIIDVLFTEIEKTSHVTLREIRNSLIEKSFIQFTNEQKSILSIFIASQILRTRKARDFYLDFGKFSMKEILKNHLKSDLGDKFDEKFLETNVNKDKESLAHSDLIITSLPKITNTLENFFYFILENESEEKFITSDNPVARFPHIKGNESSFSGILSKGIELSFPISPEHILIILENSYFEKYKKNIKPLYKTKNNEHIKFYNLLQFKDSNKQLFSNKNDFTPIEEIKKIYPNFMDNTFNVMKKSGDKNLHFKHLDLFQLEENKIGKNFVNYLISTIN